VLGEVKEEDSQKNAYIRAVGYKQNLFWENFNVFL
jgi:hypothetical protein